MSASRLLFVAAAVCFGLALFNVALIPGLDLMLLGLLLLAAGLAV